MSSYAIRFGALHDPFRRSAVESMEVSERVMDALEEHGIATVGELMDIYAQGERHMIQEIKLLGWPQ